MHQDETALFVETVTKSCNIVKAIGLIKCRNLNDPNKNPINKVQDGRYKFLLLRSTSMKLMGTSKRGQRIQNLTCDTSKH